MRRRSDSLRREAWLLSVESIAKPPAASVLFSNLYTDRSVAVWLDSARSAYGTGRYSILAAPESDLDYRVQFSRREDLLRVERSGTWVELHTDPWEWLEEELASNPIDPGALDLPFLGGFIGYFGYGMKTIGDPRFDKRGRDLELLHVTRFLVVDHLNDSLWVVACHPAANIAIAAAETWIKDMASRIESMKREPEPLQPTPQTSQTSPAKPLISAEEYRAHLELIREALFSGDSYEACYTYSLEFEVVDDPFGVYLGLRSHNPAPYGAFLKFEGRQILSASPERYLQVDAAGWADTRPIKGTTARADDPVVDRLVAENMKRDEKTRSENVMIVDLLRNDLGWISVPGSVSVPELMSIQTYAHVHQMVTTVRSKLLPSRWPALRAAIALFPPGSMTGAPKIRTVELLDSLEVGPRGVYSGVIGYFSRSGSADLSVVIRTVVIDDGRASLGTGGAITAMSDPDEEYEETIVKSAGVLAPFGRLHRDQALLRADGSVGTTNNVDAEPISTA